jgi:hypothetical protein
MPPMWALPRRLPSALLALLALVLLVLGTVLTEA